VGTTGANGMKISKSQLKRLKVSRELHGKNVSASGLFVRNWKHYLFLVGIIAAASYVFFTAITPGYTMLFLGALAGAILRDLGWFRITAQFWPVSEVITDWEKVDEIINENEEN
jgi:hypothetical protein